ncbi:hypothetical protein DFQ26_001398, partial [Actinomortierella ambigua]
MGPYFEALSSVLSRGSSLDYAICNQLAAYGFNEALDKLTIIDGQKKGNPKNDDDDDDVNKEPFQDDGDGEVL